MNKEELDKIIEKSFRTEPGFQLTSDFAQKVTFTMVRREQWKTDLREYLYLIGVLLSLFAVVSGFYYFVAKEFVLKAFAFLSENIIPVISIILILNFILFADRVLLRLLFRSLSPAPTKVG
ncbi:MAG: hypothetical protein Q8S54_08235 [Bacteroidota bacterium]|nr:hypothetical protein [Odoribacter sp.]MDP3643163.1 hypothetical protein [Bacteroidota bacterium]